MTVSSDSSQNIWARTHPEPCTFTVRKGVFSEACLTDKHLPIDLSIRLWEKSHAFLHRKIQTNTSWLFRQLNNSLDNLPEFCLKIRPHIELYITWFITMNSNPQVKFWLCELNIQHRPRIQIPSIYREKYIILEPQISLLLRNSSFILKLNCI